MNISFQHKIVVVTGAAKGIGAAIARLFQETGATVILIDIDTEAANLFPGQQQKAHFYQCDVSDPNQVKNTFEQISQKFGRIDTLVNNAGIQSHGKVADMEVEVWDRTINVNLKSAFLCSKYTIPLMKESSSPVIVNIASVQALVCEENASAYVASKAGMLGLTKAIAVDYAPHIRCVAVCPGAVNTEMLKNDLLMSDDPEKFLSDTRDIHLVKKIAEPADVASLVVFLASERAAFCTGEYYRMDGGIGARIAVM
ncbi:MAG: SDR family oxidoreductase [Flavitalea sp.]